jgi:hypothetical protein
MMRWWLWKWWYDIGDDTENSGGGDGIVHSVHKTHTLLCAKLVMMFAIVCDMLLFMSVICKLLLFLACLWSLINL